MRIFYGAIAAFFLLWTLYVWITAPERQKN